MKKYYKYNPKNRKYYLNLNTEQKCMHYFVVPFLLITPLLVFFNSIKESIETKSLVINNLEIAIPFIILSIIFYIIQKKRLVFIELKHYLNKEETDIILKDLEEYFDWMITLNNRKLIRASHRIGIFDSGEMITILRLNDKLYFNSINNPDHSGNHIFKGNNKKNLDIFSEYVKTIADNKPINEELRNVLYTKLNNLTRIIAYIFSLLFILIGCLSFLEKEVVGLFLLVIGLGYIIFDLRFSFLK